MLNSGGGPFGRVAFLHAACGREADGGNKVYSLAAAIIDRGGGVRRFSTLVRYGKAGERERYLSNLSRKKLRLAPGHPEAAAGTREFLGELSTALAFDSHSDFDELGKLFPGLRLINLNFAAEFFLPFLPSSSPKNLWEYLQGKKRAKISMSSEELVELSLELVRHIAGVQLNEREHPRAAALRHYLEASDTLFGSLFLHLNRYNREYFGGLFDAQAGTQTADWMNFLEKPEKRNGRLPRPKEVRPISLSRLDEGFRSLESSLPGHTFRHGQSQYARKVGEALNDGALLAVEAGTGTGKTLGYLLPALEFIRKNKAARVVVSTYTKNLQDQVYEREIGRIRKTLRIYRDIPASLLKGKSSYVCAEKLDDAREEEAGGYRLLAWLYFVNLLYQHRNTDLGSVGGRIFAYLDDDGYLTRLMREVSAKSGCTARHTRCPAQIMAEEAKRSSLVVTNHHKLALLDSDRALGGLFTHYIIDEATHFESAVRGAFAKEISSRELEENLKFLAAAAQRVKSRGKKKHREPLSRAPGSISRALDLLAALGDLLRSLPRGGPESDETLLVKWWEGPREHDGVSQHLVELNHAFEGVVDELEALGRELSKRTAARVSRALDLLRERTGEISALVRGAGDERSLVTFKAWRRHWVLKYCAAEVSGIIGDQILGPKESVIFTSATLCRKGSFSMFSKITSLDSIAAVGGDGASGRECRFEIFSSPYSPEAMQITIPGKAESGEFGNKEQWLESVAEALPGLVREHHGRTLVLFASYRDLEDIAGRTAVTLSAEGYPVLVQQKGLPTTDLCDEFRAVKESVLYGVDSFWYGVDFKGDTLTQVVITRIPYISRWNPLQVLRAKTMTRSEYWERYYYDADLRMRQGMGRLIRGETDRGRVVILDSRARPFVDAYEETAGMEAVVQSE